jgi:enterochelin esterase-like enzyme
MGTVDAGNRPSAILQRAARPITHLWPVIRRRLPRAAERARRMFVARASWEIGVCAALLGPLLLLRVGLLAPVDSSLTNLGFDADRVLLLDRMFCALLGACIGAGLGGRRVAGVAGAILFYTFGYILQFALQAAHPGLSPAGRHQAVIVGVYISVLLTLWCLGVLSASIGAALGGATRDLLIALAQPLRVALLRRRRHEDPRSAVAVWGRPLLLVMAGMLLAMSLIVGMGGVANVLTYGPTTGLYAPEGTGLSLRPTAPRSATVTAHRVPVAPQQGTIEQGTYVSPSLGGIARAYYIYLPPSYSVAATQRYPTVYLLHGSPGHPHDWMGPGQAPVTEDGLVAAGKMREMILVSVDGRGPVYRFSEWANSADGRQRMEDAIARDLVTYIDDHYRTLPDAADRVIVGLSEGGFGAVNIAAHHPDLFGTAISEGGYFMAQGPVFGSGPQSDAYRAYNSPALYLAAPAGQQAVSRLRFVIGDGTDDGSFYRDAATFVAQLRRAHANVAMIEVPGGHSWHNWATIFAEAIQAVERPQSVHAHHQ